MPDKFIAGVRGLQLHMVGVHGHTGITLDEIAATCDRTIFLAVDAELVRNGSLPTLEIEKDCAEGSTSVSNNHNNLAVTRSSRSQWAPPKNADAVYEIAVANAVFHPEWPSLHVNFPMVVQFADGVFSIACHVCGANAKIAKSPQKGLLFMAGVTGLRWHIRRTHRGLSLIHI